MAKPTNLALWATTGAKTEPTLGEKAAGWDGVFKPPFQWFNWWMNLIYLWVVWLDAFESTIHTWTANQTYAAGLTSGAFFLAPDGSLSIDDTGLIELGTAGDIGCVDLSVNNRIWVTGVAQFYGAVNIDGLLTQNGLSVFNSKAQFIADNNTYAIEAFGAANSGGGTGAGAAIRATASDDVTGEAIRATVTDLANAGARALKAYKQTVGAVNTPDVSFVGIIGEIWGKLKFSNANPPKTDAQLNTLCGANLIKAYAVFRGNGAVGAQPFDNGFNVATVTATAGPDEFVITFAQPMADAFYGVWVYCQTNGIFSTTGVIQKLAGSCRFGIQQADIGFVQTLAMMNGMRFAVLIIGPQ